MGEAGMRGKGTYDIDVIVEAWYLRHPRHLTRARYGGGIVVETRRALEVAGTLQRCLLDTPAGTITLLIRVLTQYFSTINTVNDLLKQG